MIYLKSHKNLIFKLMASLKTSTTGQNVVFFGISHIGNINCSDTTWMLCILRRIYVKILLTQLWMSQVKQRIMQMLGWTWRSCVRRTNCTFVQGKMETHISQKRSSHYPYSRRGGCVSGCVLWVCQMVIFPISVTKWTRHLQSCKT